MRLRNIIAAGAIAITIILPNVTHAASNVSIVSIEHPFGDNIIHLSNGVTCQEYANGSVVGPVYNYYDGWFADYYDQGNVNHKCA